MQPANLIAIRVNRKSITLKQLLHRLQVDAALSSIDRMIEDLTVEDWAETAGIAADSAGLQAAVNTFRRANGLYTAAQAGEWLGRRGMTLDDLAAMLRPQVLRKLLADHAVSGEEIRLHFLETAQQHDRCEISVIATADYGAAQELRFRVEEGVDFHQLARQYSIDRASAKAGGYLGLVGRSDLEPEMAAAVFYATPGAIVGPFERKGQFMLYLVEELFPAALDDPAKTTIREQLFRQKLNRIAPTVEWNDELWRTGEEWKT